MAGLVDDETPLVATPPPDLEPAPKKKSMMLLFSFLGMVAIGLGNKVFFKLQMIPMVNYPYDLNLWNTFVYIPLSFLYIIPMIIWGKQITPEQRAIPLYKFAIMGVLDGLAGILGAFAGNQLPGTLILLLQQSAIPVSMIASKLLLKVKYEIQHYIGACIVLAGLTVVLVPMIVKPDPTPSGSAPGPSPVMMGVWCGVMILSTVPMAASSVYKEKALGEQDVDVVYLNGWVAVFQFLVSLPLAIPAAYASNLTLKTLPKNIVDGALCYVGINSITTGDQPDHCEMAPVYVNVYLVFNVIYNILIIMILKYGSSNILWLALTLMVPLGYTAFSLHFVPGHQPLRYTSLIGLVIILGGLVMYRLFGPVKVWWTTRRNRQMGYVQTSDE
eukprot:TRINITY_DN8370_c0_g1_i1.p1 TRINITY_DN8370_c0_g1~~TRINITY_DN8370_c0_g1_i1.p1  ORF type:complete len:414 (-),score=82.02 TRINITY_DN8370_c0_g1_i1:68-1225(-)